MVGLFQLFDTFCKDQVQRSKLEKNNHLRIDEKDLWFYEDQKGLQKAKCIHKVEKPTSKELRFTQRYLPRDEQAGPSGLTDNNLDFESVLQLDVSSTSCSISDQTPPCSHHKI